MVWLLIVPVWCAVLIPWAVRAHTERRARFVRGFDDIRAGLERAAAATSLDPQPRSQCSTPRTKAARRRRVATLLGSGTLLTAAVAAPLSPLLSLAVCSTGANLGLIYAAFGHHVDQRRPHAQAEPRWVRNLTTLNGATARTATTPVQWHP